MLTRTLFKTKLHSNLLQTPFKSMASIADIKNLRSSTGSPIGECKNALEKFKGDFEKAKEWLREQGVAYADKRTERSTAQGQIGMKVVNDNQTALMIEINCETDFVAKTDMFKDGVKTYLDTLAKVEGLEISLSEKDSEEAKEKFLSYSLQSSLDPDAQSMTGSEGLTYLIAKTRENCNIGSIFRKTAREDQKWGNYLHGSQAADLCKTGSLVLMNSTNSKVDLSALANTIAMHVVAMKPTFISQSEADESEEKVSKDQILLNQELICPQNTDNLTVKAWIQKQEESHGAKITIEEFNIFSCS
ncbi:unnamed protein product [Moneuplotes crassus]|uniref:Elongation factor Ts, mitochondrial n=1 Tax=Euplotes crassus TaxID=5936 RepID=A0AAD2D0C0_EUPCR|nr:unnamed protein product [Moneuplotes crassus]